MLWAALIIASLGRDNGLAEFRRILNFIGKHDHREQLFDLTLTGIAGLEDDLRRELIGYMLEPPEVADALSTLRQFDGLPGREEWHRSLPPIESLEAGVDLLMRSVGATLWHQSQAATDCRWLRLMALAIAGKLRAGRSTVMDLIQYPEGPAQDQVRPSIRSLELALDGLTPPDPTWSTAFWHESWERTFCVASGKQYELPTFGKVVTRQSVEELREHLEEHWRETHSTTKIDPRHDGVFGMALYSVRVLEEMLGIGVGTSILGRLGLRTILEVRINLKHLLVKDTPDLWSKWRRYGAGQAKLNALKLDDSVDMPKYMDIESIEGIASEDVWEEFLTIDLGSWSGLDLRKISERSDLKGTYDRYYSWTSGYAHGMWGAVRESCYQTCGNPLHRLHRYPERRPLQDAVDDAAILVDEILQHLDDTYPRFESRLLAEAKAKPN